MANQRIVCVVVANESGVFDFIDGELVTGRIRATLDAYEFTASGISSVMQVILGNEEPPIRFDEKAEHVGI